MDHTATLCTCDYLVIVGRILCSELQLFDDDLVRPHSHLPHAFEDGFQIIVIQPPSCLANKSREHVDVGPETGLLQNKM